MKVSGRMVKCMEKDYIFGRMEENIKDSICLIKSMDTVNIIGLMAKYSKDMAKWEKRRARNDNIYEWGVESWRMEKRSKNKMGIE